MKFKISLLVIAAALLITGSSYGADKYTLDAAHSYLGFSVRHLVIANVKGHFSDFSMDLTFDENDMTKSSVQVAIKVAGIDTDNQKRDDHLRSADFFDVEKYPEMTFTSTKIEKTEDGYVMHGNLTMHGTTKEIAVSIDFLGKTVGPGGKERIGFEGYAKVDRRDFGMTWSKTIETGGLVVGHEVKIELQIEAVKM
ncbi:MAG: polyisoprenoid-binding protein [Candidatus Zixiibacteriota bacterium]|nr:MAG: polyisoprenoid-binding protein [candidate division Zixibacteria bacterium]